MKNDVTYEELLQLAEEDKVLYISDCAIVAEQITINYESEDFGESPKRMLRKLANYIENPEIKCYGTPDEYHNLSVAYARANLFDSACKILKSGLNEVEFSIDLLADFIKYGLSCGEYQQCEEYYLKLKKRPIDLWNWRAFSFSIDYLLNKINRVENESEIAEIKSEALELSDTFTEKFNNDQSYYDKSTIYKAFNDSKNETDVLIKVVESEKPTPKCAMRLADIKTDEGDYHKAIHFIKICCTAFETQPGVNRGYAYLLMALGKTSTLFKCLYNEENTQVDNKIVEEIYRDFYTALECDLDGVYKKTAKNITKVIKAQTGVSFPEEYRSLSDNNEDLYD